MSTKRKAPAPQKPIDPKIAEVIKEEANRGRRSPAAIDAKRRWVQFCREYEALLEYGTEADLLEAVTRLRLPVDSDGWERLRKEYREHRRS